MVNNNWGRIQRFERYAKGLGVGFDEWKLHFVKERELKKFVEENPIGYSVLKGEDSYVAMVNKHVYDLPFSSGSKIRQGRSDDVCKIVSSMNDLNIRTYVQVPVARGDLSNVRIFAKNSDSFLKNIFQEERELILRVDKGL